MGLGDPGYPSYRQILRALSLVPVGIETRLENRLQPVPADLPDDMAGLKIRVPNSDLYVAMIRALGADATPMPLKASKTTVTLQDKDARPISSAGRMRTTRGRKR